MWITRVSVNNPVFATMMMVALLVLGVFSYQHLEVDQFPNVNFPVVVVQTEYPGASPETVESDVSRKIEDAVNTVSGVKTISSRSYEGQSVVIIEFDLVTDPAMAAQDVREKLALLRPSFRDEVKEPKISRFDPDDQPIVSVAVRSSMRNLRELTTLADQVIAKRLSSVPGVGSVTLVGGVKREVKIALKPDALEAFGVGVDQVVSAIRSENQMIPAGSVASLDQERLVQVEGRIQDPAGFARIIVARRAAMPVYLSQVADVIDGQQDEESIALVNGKQALALDIVKVQGANTIAVTDGAREMIAELGRTLPADVRLEMVHDSSLGIRNSVANVQQTLLEGAALTIAIVFIFLNSWRSTVITGLTLPIALIGTFLLMYAFGFTLNIMTLMALSLCVGLLIDDAIVVRENIVRHLAMGKDHVQAALDGTQEIGLAVMATTFTIVAVFLPVAFMGGIIGRFLFQFGMTVSTAVLLSMFVSFTLNPMLSSVWHDSFTHGEHSKRHWARRLLALHDRLIDGVARIYDRLLRWGLVHRKSVLAIALVSFFGSFALIPLVGSEFLPQPDLNETGVQVTTSVGSTLEYTQAKVRQVEGALREFPEVVATYATINTGTALSKNSASIYVRLKPRKERSRSQQDLAQPFRERLKSIAGIEISVAPVPVGDAKPILVSVQGQDLKVLEKLSEQGLAIMRQIPGLVDLESSLKADKPAVAVRLDRELASDLGVGVGQVGASLHPLLAGQVVSNWKAPDGENYDVTVRLPQTQRESVADLERIYLTSAATHPDGSPRIVALRQVADFVPSLGASQISRKDLTREVQLTANVAGRPAGDAGQELKAALEKLETPTGYRFSMGGSTKDMQETMGYAGAALLLAVIFIYLILASQFGSFLQPLAIMMSLPLALIGVVLALLLAGSTLNIFSIIGFITLLGLVTKNAILLVDFINQAVNAGQSRFEAIVAAGAVRLRPILMTTLAMIFGMIPLALGIGEGAELRTSMAHAVIGGIITSTVLTLVVVPVIYTYLDDFAAWAKRARL